MYLTLPPPLLTHRNEDFDFLNEMEFCNPEDAEDFSEVTDTGETPN
jgi:hypothetical protein